MTKKEASSPSTGANSPPDRSKQPDFESHARAVLGGLCRAAGRLVESLPGPIRGAGDLQRLLGVDKALSWQLFRLASVPDPIAAGPDVPRLTAMKRALRAAEARGAPAPVIADVLNACMEFEGLVKRHAGNRSAFDSMMRGLRTDTDQVHARERRAAYKALGSIWGVQADCCYMSGAFHPGARPGTEDAAMICGYTSLRKLRPGAHLHIAGHSFMKSTPSGVDKSILAHHREIGLLREFSMDPFPPLAMHETPDGMMETAAEIDAVGHFGAITYFTREVGRELATELQPRWGSNCIVRTPSEVLVMDQLVPAGWSDPTTRQVATYGNLRKMERALEKNDADRLPVTETILYLGRDLDRLRTPLVPRCPEMVASVLRELSWERTEFDIYRCVVQYPILHAGVSIQVDAAAGRPSKE